MIRTLLVAIVAITSLTATAAAQSEPVTADDRNAAIERIITLFNDRYVFPEIAARCGDHLAALRDDGAFDELTDPAELAERLTNELRAISTDLHVLVRVRAQPAPPATNAEPRAPEHPITVRARRMDAARRVNFGFESVSILENNIGYLDIRHFSGHRQARQLAESAMTFLANTDALIVDLRKNGGGDPDMVRVLCSYLFDEPTHLNSLYWRDGDRTDEFWTIDVPGPRRSDVPVFVLTSAETFSGAEEFGHNLQTRKRATIIGETTRGGANPGALIPVNDQLEIFIPTGRAINPITGTNWEGTGVTPDVPSPAEDALEKALTLAAPAAEQYRDQLNAAWDAFDPWHAEARGFDDEDDATSAARAVTEALQHAHDHNLINEGDINQYGYEFLGESRFAMAIAAFELNVRLHPDSANCYDSLGEACRAAGHIERAITNYTRALELDPHGPNAPAAQRSLDELRAMKSGR